MTNTVPRFISTPQTWFKAVTAVNTTFAGSGSLDTIITAPAEGSKIDYMMFQAQAATLSNVLNIFLSTANDTSYYWDQVTIAATTAPSSTSPGWVATLTPAEPLFLPSGCKLKMALYTAATINVFVQGGDY